MKTKCLLLILLFILIISTNYVFADSGTYITKEELLDSKEYIQEGGLTAASKALNVFYLNILIIRTKEYLLQLGKNLY